MQDKNMEKVSGSEYFLLCIYQVPRFLLAESCVHVGAWQIAQKVKKKDGDLHWFCWALRP